MIYRILFFLFSFCLIQSVNAQKSIDTANTNKPRHIVFTPDTFYNSFSVNPKPVLYLNSGDSVFTETIDASGHDKNGVKRQKAGNPLTGPFCINASKAGDMLKINLVKVSLNRDNAYTTDVFVSRSMPDSIVSLFKKTHLVKWKLDIQNGFASLDSSYTVDNKNLGEFKVPLHPFLGCIGVAPKNKKNEILSFFQGDFGGNMDFSSIAKGSTIYLPLFHDGGYFYIGDGHALQGDGEIAGNALETSLYVEFSIELIKNNRVELKSPRVEDATYIMALGSAKTLDKAIKSATAGLLDWLQQDYHLTKQECTQVMSTGIEYAIAEIADPEIIVVAKIKKELLKQLKKNN
ncbi:MAG TPA: acetamidase/formamidase family protein [Puia sp.]|nr:acetamidase/formamidase family protein [Puia sp.]